MQEQEAKPFGKLVKEARLAIGISLREAARRLDVSPSLLSSIELNREGLKPKDDLIKGMAALYKVKQATLREAAKNIENIQVAKKGTVSPLVAFRRLAYEKGYRTDAEIIRALKEVLPAKAR